MHLRDIEGGAASGAAQELISMRERVRQIQEGRRLFSERVRDDPLGAVDMLRANIEAAAHAIVYAPIVAGQAHAALDRLPREMRAARSNYAKAAADDAKLPQLSPVPINGDPELGARRGYFQAPIRLPAALHGQAPRVGYLQRRPDDCLRMAIATLLQTPPYEIPDLNLDKLHASGKDPEEVRRIVGNRMGQWFVSHALTLGTHPTQLPSKGWWIGLVEEGVTPSGQMATHTLILLDRDVVFDTAWLLPPGEDEPVSDHGFDDVGVGFTIHRR